MPVRVRAKPPGEFIRDHLVAAGGMDYPQSIYNAYKEYLRSQGLKDGITRASMSKYIWLANKLRLIEFDHAEASERWGAVVDGVTVPPAYIRESRPQAPSPRHYYRIIDPADPRWIRLEASYRQSIGIEVPPMFPRVPIKPAPPPVKKPPKVVKPPKVKKPPKKIPKVPPPEVIVEPYEMRVREILDLLEELERSPSLELVAEIEDRLIEVGEDVVEAHKRARGRVRTLLGILNSRLRTGLEEVGLLRSTVQSLLIAPTAVERRRWQSALSAAIRVMREDLRPSE